MTYLVLHINLTLVDYLTKEYRTFECLKQKAILPSKTQKNGLTLPSKLPTPNTAEHYNQHTTLPTTSSTTITTHSLPPAKHNKYLCANWWVQHNSNPRICPWLCSLHQTLQCAQLPLRGLPVPAWAVPQTRAFWVRKRAYDQVCWRQWQCNSSDSWRASKL